MMAQASCLEMGYDGAQKPYFIGQVWTEDFSKIIHEHNWKYQQGCNGI